MTTGSSKRYLEALWKFLCVVVILHLIILTSAYFSSNITGLLGLKVFWAHVSSGIGALSISLILAILVYYGIYRYWTKH